MNDAKDSNALFKTVKSRCARHQTTQGEFRNVTYRKCSLHTLLL